MTINQTIYERGKTAGIFPSLSSRRDEAYVGFIEDARNLLLHAQQKPIGEYSRSLLQDAGKSMETDPKSSAEAQELLMKDSVLKTYYRVKRSLQESFWVMLRKLALAQSVMTLTMLWRTTPKEKFTFSLVVMSTNRSLALFTTMV